MNDDMRLQELFDSYHPTLVDSELFNQRLERKLAMIDEIRQAQVAQKHRYRVAVVAAFVHSFWLHHPMCLCSLSASISTHCFSSNRTAVSFLHC